MCMIDNADRAVEVLKTKLFKAKVWHLCKECRRRIMPGEVYLYEATVLDGDFKIHKTCQHCLAPRQLIYDKCHGFIYGEIAEDLSDHINAPEWGFRAARYLVGMRRKWRKFYSDELLPVGEA